MKRDAYVVVKELFDAEIEDAKKSILRADKAIDYLEDKLFKVDLIDALAERLDDKDPKKGLIICDCNGYRSHLREQIEDEKERIKSLYMHILMIESKKPYSEREV